MRTYSALLLFLKYTLLKKRPHFDCFVVGFGTQSAYSKEASLEFLILLPEPPELRSQTYPNVPSFMFENKINQWIQCHMGRVTLKREARLQNSLWDLIYIKKQNNRGQPWCGTVKV